MNENSNAKAQALKELNEAIRKCREAGVEMGVGRVWNGRGKWALYFGEEVEWTPFAPQEQRGSAGLRPPTGGLMGSA